MVDIIPVVSYTKGMTKTETRTRKAHDLKGGDIVRIGRNWREIFDAYPNTESTFVVVYYNGSTPDAVTYTLAPVDADYAVN